MSLSSRQIRILPKAPGGGREDAVTQSNRRELHKVYAKRYKSAKRAEKSRLLSEFCEMTGYHRKYATSLLRSGPPAKPSPKARPPVPARYTKPTEKMLVYIWKAADYPWSVRLKAILPLWLPWLASRITLLPEVEAKLLAMSPRTMDRLLKPHRIEIKRKRYTHTKPGTLLKHHITIKTSSWDVKEPGYTEIDCVAHCGNSGDGEFINSVNMTDIHTTWTETYAVLGKGRHRVCDGIDRMRSALPFALKGIDSDNGSEFINAHLYEYCVDRTIQFTRGRPYKKNDNAHIEQKNWTHVRRILGWARFESQELLDAINDLYRNELRLFMNFFQPTVKLLSKERIGSKVVRKYSDPQTPLDRVLASEGVDEAMKAELRRQRATLDPFALSERIEAKLVYIGDLASQQTLVKVHRGGKPAWTQTRAPDEYIPEVAG
jgi:hypothetical protein